MNIATAAINILFAMLSAVLILSYLKRTGIWYDSSKKIIFILAFGIISGLSSTQMTSLGNIVNTIRPIILSIICISIIKYFLDISFVNSIIVFSLLVISMGIGNALVLLFFGFFIKGYVIGVILSNPILYITSNSITLFVTFLLFHAVKPVSKMIRQVISSKELAFALILTISILSANTSLYYYMKVFNKTAFILNTIMSLVYYIYVIFVCTVIYRKHLEKSEKDQQDFYNKSLESSLFNLRRFKHDWNNNLSVLNAMLTMKKYDEARGYLHEIMEYNASNTTYVYNIKNAGLFGIISSKQKLAQDKGLNIKVAGEGEINIIPEIKISELCEIIGIFLDNAIEESEKIHEDIELDYLDSDRAIEIRIKNKCGHDVDLPSISKISLKGPDRGNGLHIVDQIVRKYKSIQNSKSYDIETKIFEQLIIIDKGLK